MAHLHARVHHFPNLYEVWGPRRGVLMSHVDFKKYICRPVELKKCSCPPVEFKKLPCCTKPLSTIQCNKTLCRDQLVPILLIG